MGGLLEELSRDLMGWGLLDLETLSRDLERLSQRTSGDF
jgi:hypothetical protein